MCRHAIVNPHDDYARLELLGAGAAGSLPMSSHVQAIVGCGRVGERKFRKWGGDVLSSIERWLA